MRRLTIGHLAKVVGIPPKTIRFYEEEGLLRAPERSESGYRLFSPDDVRRLQLIKRAKLLGLSLGEIRELVDESFHESCQDLRGKLLELIPTRLSEIDQRISELEAFRGQLEALQGHLQHVGQRLKRRDRVATCEYCPVLTDDAIWATGRHETHSL